MRCDSHIARLRRDFRYCMKTPGSSIALTVIIVPLVGSDTQSHLMGTHMFVRAQEYPSSDIWQAAFRVVLRQEIVFAFRNQRPVQLLREYIQMDQSMDRDDDWTATLHIIVLCAEVLSYCYGENSKAVDTWTQLSDRSQSWMSSRSPSLQTLRYVTAETSRYKPFPELWLLNDCHGGRSCGD